MNPMTQQLVMMVVTTVMGTLIGWMIRWNVLFVEQRVGLFSTTMHSIAPFA